MENKVKDQLVTDRYALYNSDCMLVMPTLQDKSIDLSVYSPPFAGLYNYSSSENDFSNCETKEQFLDQYEYLIKEIARVTKDGRITAVHCTDVFDNTCRLWDNDLERAFKGSYAYNGAIVNAQIHSRRFY
mgnify:CR=1 FL=1